MKNSSISGITDIVNEIKEIDKLINLHKSGDDDNFMISQYETKKKDFLKDLINELIKIPVSSYQFSHFIKRVIDKYFDAEPIKRPGWFDDKDRELNELEALI